MRVIRASSKRLKIDSETNLYKVGHGFRNLIIGILGALPILIVCAAVIAVIVVIVKKSIKKITFKKLKKAKENDHEENFK